MLRASPGKNDGIEIVLTTDETLLAEYRKIPLGQFFSCVPSDIFLSRMVHTILMPPAYVNSPVVEYAPMGLRRFESALARDIGRENVAVVSPRHLRRFIGKKTKVVGIHTMDPLGIGPVSLMFTVGRKYTPFTKHMFHKVLKEIPKKRGFKVAVGGCGTWQLEYFPEEIERMGIDHVVSGECDHIAGKVLEKIDDGSERIIRIPEPAPTETICPNLGATMLGLVEVMRGCGRGCKFCQPNLRKARFIPFDVIKNDVILNVRMGQTKVWAHSDDIFLYKVESRELYPNKDAIKELFSFIMGIKGVTHANPTHGSLAGVASAPDLIEDLSRILRARKDKRIGIQPGMETGSGNLMRKIMPRKTLPYQPEEWPQVVIEAVRTLNKNYWLPGLTLIVGLPEETPEDIKETIEVIKKMENEGLHFIVAPLAFVPLAAWREKKFLDFANQFDESRFNLVYACWKHTIHEIDVMFSEVVRLQSVSSVVIDVLAKYGSRYVLKEIERWGTKRGFRVWHG